MSSDDTETDLGQQMEIRDDDEHSTHTRRKRLLEDLREKAISDRMEAHAQQVSGQISQSQARRYYRGSVSGYLKEVFQAISADEVSLQKDYEHEVYLGEVVFEPPDALVQFARDNMHRLLPEQTVPSPVKMDIVGLRQITQLPSPLSYTFTVDYRSGGKMETKASTVETELSQRVLDNAIEEANEALSEVGVGLDINEGDRVVKIDRDLLEEVHEWRQDNL